MGIVVYDKSVHPDFVDPSQKPFGRVEFDENGNLSAKLSEFFLFHDEGNKLRGVKRHVGSIVNGAWADGALVFNGSSTVATVPANNDFVLGTSDFIIYVKARMTGGGASHNGIVSVDYDNANGWAIYAFDDNDSIRFRSGDGSIYADGGFGSFAAGVDHEILVRRVGSTLTLYVDWVQVASDTTASQNLSRSAPLTLGRRNAATNFLDGAISELLIIKEAPGLTQIREKRYLETLEPVIPLTCFIPSAGGGTTINASLESISLTENASTVSLDKSITAALESILLTEYQSNTDLDKTVNGSVESISLSGLSASVQANIDTDISAAQESIQVSELAASISSGSSISAALESITVSGLASNVALDKNISAGIESISVSENAAQITLGSNVAAVLEGITLTEHQAGVVLDVAINAAQESITINQLAAMIGLATDIDAVKENITLTESGATLTLDTSIGAATEQISLTTFNFTLTSSISTPNQPGLEYTIPISKMGYTIPVGKIHFTFREED